MADQEAGIARARAKESSNQPQGRSGSKVKTMPGPVKSVSKNPTKGGGINRATKGD